MNLATGGFELDPDDAGAWQTGGYRMMYVYMNQSFGDETKTRIRSAS